MQQRFGLSRNALRWRDRRAWVAGYRTGVYGVHVEPRTTFAAAMTPYAPGHHQSKPRAQDRRQRGPCRGPRREPRAKSTTRRMLTHRPHAGLTPQLPAPRFRHWSYRSRAVHRTRGAVVSAPRYLPRDICLAISACATGGAADRRTNFAPGTNASKTHQVETHRLSGSDCALPRGLLSPPAQKSAFRVSMLTQLLVIAVPVVALQFGIRIKVAR